MGKIVLVYVDIWIMEEIVNKIVCIVFKNCVILY